MKHPSHIPILILTGIMIFPSVCALAQISYTTPNGQTSYTTFTPVNSTSTPSYTSDTPPSIPSPTPAPTITSYSPSSNNMEWVGMARTLASNGKQPYAVAIHPNGSVWIACAPDASLWYSSAGGTLQSTVKATSVAAKGDYIWAGGGQQVILISAANPTSSITPASQPSLGTIYKLIPAASANSVIAVHASGVSKLIFDPASNSVSVAHLVIGAPKEGAINANEVLYFSQGTDIQLYQSGSSDTTPISINNENFTSLTPGEQNNFYALSWQTGSSLPAGINTLVSTVSAATYTYQVHRITGTTSAPITLNLSASDLPVPGSLSCDESGNLSFVVSRPVTSSGTGAEAPGMIYAAFGTGSAVSYEIRLISYDFNGNAQKSDTLLWTQPNYIAWMTGDLSGYAKRNLSAPGAQAPPAPGTAGATPGTSGASGTPPVVGAPGIPGAPGTTPAGGGAGGTGKPSVGTGAGGGARTHTGQQPPKSGTPPAPGTTVTNQDGSTTTYNTDGSTTTRYPNGNVTTTQKDGTSTTSDAQGNPIEPTSPSTDTSQTSSDPSPPLGGSGPPVENPGGAPPIETPPPPATPPTGQDPAPQVPPNPEIPPTPPAPSPPAPTPPTDPANDVETLKIINASIQEIVKVEQPFTHTFQAVGGVPPYSWEWDNNLPEGMKMEMQHDKCTLSGTPTKAENRVIHLTVTDNNKDKNANSTAKDITINVRDKSKEEVETAKQEAAEKALKKAQSSGCHRNGNANPSSLLPLLLLGFLILSLRRSSVART